MKTFFIIIALVLNELCMAQVQPGNQEIFITEIFPDPSTNTILPQKEFVEIYNSSADTVDLKGFVISDSSKQFDFPAFQFPPQSFLILCKVADTSEFNKYGAVLGFSSFISLNNGGDRISLYSPEKVLLNEVEFDKNYLKGITLELTNYSSCIKGEWQPSEDSKGGTPGTVNSVVRNDTITPTIIIDQITEQILSIHLSTALKQDNPLFKIIIDENEIPLSKVSFSTDSKSLELKLNNILFEGKNYSLQLINVITCAGQTFQNLKKDFNLTAAADSLDIIINEVLFNPHTGYPDFIEIYNQSNKFLELSTIDLVSIKENNKEERFPVCIEKRIISPGEIILITSDVAKLCEKYNCPDKSNMIESTIPSFNNDNGVVVLSKEDKIIDLFHYSENLHFPLLEIKEGVSLEKIHPSLSSNAKDSWHSAASTVGFATPGIPNSSSKTFNAQSDWALEPKAFSPNNDGYNDFTSLSCNNNNPSTVVSVTIYNSEGIPIKNLLNNATISSSDFIKWDGCDEESMLAPIGHYIFKIETFNMDGDKEDFKRTVVITSP